MVSLLNWFEIGLCFALNKKKASLISVKFNWRKSEISVEWLQCSLQNRKPPHDQANLFLCLNSVYRLSQEFHSNKIMLMCLWSICLSSREKNNSRKEFLEKAQ